MKSGDIMQKSVSISSVMNSFIPISRFNKGEASKIFKEVNESGFKIVLKNNTPTCILITPKAYEEMLETIENYRLFIETEKRMETTKPEDFISEEIVMQKLGITDVDLKNTEVEFE